MKRPNCHIFLSSPNSLLISFEFKEYGRQSIFYIQDIKSKISEQFKMQVSYITPAFDTLLVNFNAGALDLRSIKKDIISLIKQTTISEPLKKDVNTYEIPVCYEPYGIDLESISKHSGLNIDDIISIHSEKHYTLYFVGFIPGFLYMGKIDKRINIPRLMTPRQNVEKGSVGIAEDQTGIYPSPSPGGWQIIGRTPSDIFNVNDNPPSPFEPGDQIKFKPINEQEFQLLKHKQNQNFKML